MLKNWWLTDGIAKGVVRMCKVNILKLCSICIFLFSLYACEKIENPVQYQESAPSPTIKIEQNMHSSLQNKESNQELPFMLKSKVWKKLYSLEKAAKKYKKKHPKTEDSANQLIVQYIRTGKDAYNTNLWILLAGKVNKKFVLYVNRWYPELKSLQSTEKMKDPYGEGEIDFIHFIASLGVLMKQSVYSQELCDLVTWKGDCIELAQEVYLSGIDSEHITRETITKMGENSSRFNHADYLADIDAYNIAFSMQNSETSLCDAIHDYYKGDQSTANREAMFCNVRLGKEMNEKAAIRWLKKEMTSKAGFFTRELCKEHKLSLQKQKKYIVTAAEAFGQYLFRKE